MERNLAILAAVALAACTPDFDPASQVDKLRVLAIQAEPPEIEPAGATTVAADRAALTSLVLDAEPAGTATVVHVACIPTPGNPAASPCLAFEQLRDPAATLAGAAPGACTGPVSSSGFAIGFAGVEACAAASCGPASASGSPLPPAEVALGALAPGFTFAAATGPERILGVQAVVLSFAIDAAPDELVSAGAATTPCPAGDLATGVARLWASREHVLATKRIVIRGPDAPDPPNANPRFDPDLGIAADGVPLDPATATTVTRGEVSLRPSFTAAFPQQFWELDAAGQKIERKTEDWVYSWFSTAGELAELHTRGGESDPWAVTGPASAVVAVVARDLRGGTRWAVRRVVVR